MPLKLKYLVSDPDRHGNQRLYVRRGILKVRLRCDPEAPAFEEEYAAAIDFLAEKLSRIPKDFTYLYAVAPDGPGTPVKIGITRTLKKRLQGLQNGHHLRLRMVPIAQVPNASALQFERAVHEHFAASRLVGEWFDITVLQAVSVVSRIMPEHARPCPTFPGC